MKSWLISEDEIREIIKNCDEIVNSNNPTSDMFHSKACVIRDVHHNNPVWEAIYASVVSLDNENARRFAQNLSDWLRDILEHKLILANSYCEKEIFEKAIEVENQT